LISSAKKGEEIILMYISLDKPKKISLILNGKKKQIL